MGDALAQPRAEGRIRNWVSQRCSPRVAMSVLLLATTAAGSLASFVLLHAGVTHFGIRYALAVLASYAVLIGLIRLWVRYEARRLEGGNGGSPANALDLLDGNGSSSGSSWGGGGGGGGSGRLSAGGGRFGGGGASGSYDDGATSAKLWSSSPSPSTPSSPLVSEGTSSAGNAGSSGGSGKGGGFGFSIDLDGDEIIVLILVLLALTAAVLAAGYIIWIAPNFLGDMLLATVAGAGLSRKVSSHEPGWMGLVVKRTALPAVAVLVMFTIAGFALQHYAPGAGTLHGVWQAHLARHADR
jgi:uncharacterized membrane protein YgcG